MTLVIVAFTARGGALAARLREALPDCEAYALPRHSAPPLLPLEEDLFSFTRHHFQKGRGLVFVGAAGIAVRAIAPLVRSKDTDPAVLCIDEAGRWVIPLLSGHLGGANRLAGELAALCGGVAVLTTATDVNGVFSPDAWAAGHDCVVAKLEEIKHISAALLEGEPVGFATPFVVHTPLPPGICRRTDTRCGIEIALWASAPFAHTLHLLPRRVVAGIGCRRDVPEQVIEARLCAVLAEHHLPVSVVEAVATIDRKAEEPGLLALCRHRGLSFQSFSAQELWTAKGTFASSQRVLEVTGVDNVCERAVVLAGGELFARKTTGDGVTVALGIREYIVAF